MEQPGALSKPKPKMKELYPKKILIFLQNHLYLKNLFYFGKKPFSLTIKTYRLLTELSKPKHEITMEKFLIFFRKIFFIFPYILNEC